MANFPDINRVRFDSEQLTNFGGAREMVGEQTERLIFLVLRHGSRLKLASLVRRVSAPRRPRVAEPSEISYTRCMSVPNAILSSPMNSKEPRQSESLFAAGERSNGTSWQILQGDCREAVTDIVPGSVNTVITSPPYYWQRDYEVSGQFGLEPTIDGFVENLVGAFAAIKPALAHDGSVFLNLGDTFYSAKGKPHGQDNKHRSRRLPGLRAVDGPGLGLPRKSLIGIPWRVALAMQADGWTLRSAIIWVKKSAMPEPTSKDRPWRQYEHIFQFSKSPRYFFDRAGLEGEEDVWSIEPDRKSLARGVHYAPYPRKLVERCISIGCPEGGVVLDPFLGGGTTMYVADQMGRSSIGVELNPNFCGLVADNMAKIPDAS